MKERKEKEEKKNNVELPKDLIDFLKLVSTYIPKNRKYREEFYQDLAYVCGIKDEVDKLTEDFNDLSVEESMSKLSEISKSLKVNENDAEMFIQVYYTRKLILDKLKKKDFRGIKIDRLNSLLKNYIYLFSEDDEEKEDELTEKLYSDDDFEFGKKGKKCKKSVKKSKKKTVKKIKKSFKKSKKKIIKKSVKKSKKTVKKSKKSVKRTKKNSKKSVRKSNKKTKKTKSVKRN